MLRKALFTCLLLTLCLASGAFADAVATQDGIPTASPNPIATGFGTDDLGLPQTAVAETPTRGQFLAGSCSATADCHDGSTVSCSTSSGSCSFVDANCSNSQRGYVRCGSSYTYCPSCPSCSINGASCSSSAWCASKCDLVCDIDGGFCINGQCQCGLF